METFNSGIEKESLICAQCGYCQAVCPVFDVIGWESSGPRARMAIAHQATMGQSLDQEQVQRVFQCTLCGRCREVCSTRIDTGAIWLELRKNLYTKGHVDNLPLVGVRNNLVDRQNITGEEADKRLLWQENLDSLPDTINLQAGVELVYFVGCVAGLYPQTNIIPTSLTEILSKSGISFTTMGGKEICCGFPALGLGHPDLAAEFARRNLDTMKELKAKALVATCPSCYHTWRYVYPELLKEPTGIEVMHSSQLLNWLMNEGRLKLEPLNERVTYHDPCDLGRNSGVYDSPRQVLQAIPGLELVEMENNRENAVCCGGGGNLEVVDPELAQTIATQRIQQAMRTGASILVTPCQQCKRTLTKAARANRARLKVMDLVEIINQQME